MSNDNVNQEKPRVTGHTVTPKDPLVIEILDEKGPGGAHHSYRVGVREEVPGGANFSVFARVRFQKGSLGETGTPNGATIESLIAIAAHRLDSFQRGGFPCEENATALAHLQKALDALHSRTRRRQAAGIEGKNVEIASVPPPPTPEGNTEGEGEPPAANAPEGESEDKGTGGRDSPANNGDEGAATEAPKPRGGRKGRNKA